MTFLISNTKRICLFLVLGLFAGLYIQHHPYTVQFGDSAELISRAYASAVAHPPGYPLFLWLMKISTLNTDPQNVFSTASLLNIAMSLACLGLIGFFPKNRILGIGAILILGLSSIYWRYTEIPDVFILNSFLCAGLVCAYARLFDEDLVAQKFAIPVILFFFLGLANHLTMIFLFPLVLHTIWATRNNVRTWISIATGFALCIGLYLSQLYFNTQSTLSWGDLSTPTDVLKHFLRSDYGTFQLSGHKEGSYFLEIAQFFVKKLITDFWSLLIVGGLFALFSVRNKGRPKLSWFLILFCLAAYIVLFFSLSNINPVDFGSEVLSRFFILPEILFIYLVLQMGQKLILTPAQNILLLCFFVLAGAFNFLQNSLSNDFSKNTIVEDYAIDLLALRRPNQRLPFWPATRNCLLRITCSRYLAKAKM